MLPTDRPIRVVKNVAPVIANNVILAAKARKLKRIDDIESELGRLMRLVRDLRADELHESVVE